MRRNPAEIMSVIGPVQTEELSARLELALTEEQDRQDFIHGMFWLHREELKNSRRLSPIEKVLINPKNLSDALWQLQTYAELYEWDEGLLCRDWQSFKPEKLDLSSLFPYIFEYCRVTDSWTLAEEALRTGYKLPVMGKFCVISQLLRPDSNAFKRGQSKAIEFVSTHIPREIFFEVFAYHMQRPSDLNYFITNCTDFAAADRFLSLAIHHDPARFQGVLIEPGKYGSPIHVIFHTLDESRCELLKIYLKHGLNPNQIIVIQGDDRIPLVNYCIKLISLEHQEKVFRILFESRYEPTGYDLSLYNDFTSYFCSEGLSFNKARELAEHLRWFLQTYKHQPFLEKGRLERVAIYFEQITLRELMQRGMVDSLAQHERMQIVSGLHAGINDARRKTLERENSQGPGLVRTVLSQRLLNHEQLTNEEKDLCIKYKDVIIDLLLGEHKNNLRILEEAENPRSTLGKIINTHREPPKLSNLWHRAEPTAVKQIKERCKQLRQEHQKYTPVPGIPVFCTKSNVRTRYQSAEPTKALPQDLENYAEIFNDNARLLFPNKTVDRTQGSLKQLEVWKAVLTPQERAAVKKNVGLHYSQKSQQSSQALMDLLALVEIPEAEVGCTPSSCGAAPAAAGPSSW